MFNKANAIRFQIKTILVYKFTFRDCSYLCNGDKWTKKNHVTKKNYIWMNISGGFTVFTFDTVLSDIFNKYNSYVRAIRKWKRSNNKKGTALTKKWTSQFITLSVCEIAINAKKAMQNFKKKKKKSANMYTINTRRTKKVNRKIVKPSCKRKIKFRPKN